MAKKMKRYNGEDESEVKFETKTGKNEAIGEDTRARAMKFLENATETKREVTPKSTSTAKKTVAKAKESIPMPDYSNEDLDRMDAEMAAAERKRESQAFLNRTPSRFDPAAAAGVRRPAAAPNFMMKAMGYKSGGKVKSASSRADGCAIRGKTRA